MTARETLIKEIEAFMAEHHMRPTMFGKLALNDPALMGSLRSGRDVKLETADRIRKYMRDYKPPRRQPRPKARPRGSPLRAVAA